MAAVAYEEAAVSLCEAGAVACTLWAGGLATVPCCSLVTVQVEPTGGAGCEGDGLTWDWPRAFWSAVAIAEEPAAEALNACSLGPGAADPL